MGSAIAGIFNYYGQKDATDAQQSMQGDWLNFLRYEAPGLALDQAKAMQDLFAGPGLPQDLIEGIMGRGGEGQILNYLFQPPVKMTAAEKRELGLYEGAEPLMNEIVQSLKGLAPSVDELTQTGFRTDIQPI